MYDNLINDHEEEFIKDTTETGRFILSIGSKGSGKSYLLCNYLKYCLMNNSFESIIFVCPCYDGEANDSYDFLKNQKHVMIYKSYSEAVSKAVDKERRKKKTLFLIDDASGELLRKMDNTFIQIITTTRHFKKCTVYVCVHSAKRILAPVVRQNIDHLFMYKIINLKLLEDLYDEYLSMMFNSFKDYKEFYLEATTEKNSCVHFSLHNDGLDIDVKNWALQSIKCNLKSTKPPSKPKPKESEPKPFSLNISQMFKRYKKRY